MKTIILIFFLAISLPSELIAAESSVATVLKMRGKVLAKLTDGQEVQLKLDQKIPVGTLLTTSPNSFVRLIFLDKSVINLGPLSSMHIQAFPKNEAGIIKLLKGQIRAEVTKNYMEMDDKNKSKLFIRTKTAAMGIRGTDFQVNYNPINQNSSLIVFEGKVVMGHIDRAIQNDLFVQKKLEEIVSSNTAVLVKQGEISVVNLNVSDRVLIPTKLAPKQLDILKENPTGLEEDAKKIKKFRDIVPPDVDSNIFIKTSPDTLKVQVEEARGFFNDKTSEYKPAAGTIIDLKTVNIIAPPPEAKFDPATKTFVITENFGKIDERTGQFKAPAGYELSNEGQYQLASRDSNMKIDENRQQKPSGERPVAQNERKSDTATNNTISSGSDTKNSPSSPGTPVTIPTSTSSGAVGSSPPPAATSPLPPPPVTNSPLPPPPVTNSPLPPPPVTNSPLPPPPVINNPLPPPPVINNPLPPPPVINNSLPQTGL